MGDGRTAAGDRALVGEDSHSHRERALLISPRVGAACGRERVLRREKVIARSRKYIKWTTVPRISNELRLGGHGRTGRGVCVEAVGWVDGGVEFLRHPKLSPSVVIPFGMRSITPLQYTQLGSDPLGTLGVGLKALTPTARWSMGGSRGGFSRDCRWSSRSSTSRSPTSSLASGKICFPCTSSTSIRCRTAPTTWWSTTSSGCALCRRVPSPPAASPTPPPPRRASSSPASSWRRAPCKARHRACPRRPLILARTLILFAAPLAASAVRGATMHLHDRPPGLRPRPRPQPRLHPRPHPQPRLHPHPQPRPRPGSTMHLLDHRPHITEQITAVTGMYVDRMHTCPCMRAACPSLS